MFQSAKCYRRLSCFKQYVTINDHIRHVLNWVNSTYSWQDILVDNIVYIYVGFVHIKVWLYVYVKNLKKQNHLILCWSLNGRLQLPLLIDILLFWKFSCSAKFERVKRQDQIKPGRHTFVYIQAPVFTLFESCDPVDMGWRPHSHFCYVKNKSNSFQCFDVVSGFAHTLWISGNFRKELSTSFE